METQFPCYLYEEGLYLELILKKVRPIKKDTEVLFRAIESSVINESCAFSEHAYKRSLKRRDLSTYEVFRILLTKSKWHEKAKDKYIEGMDDWNYHIRGYSSNNENVRIVLSFDIFGVVIITVINLSEG